MSKTDKPNSRITAKIVLGIILILVFTGGYAVGAYLT